AADGIGTAATPLTTAVDTVQATAGGDITLAEADRVLLWDTGLDAGAHTLFLTGGTFVLGASDQIADATSVSVQGAVLDIKTFGDVIAGLRLTAGSVVGTAGVLTSATTIDVQSG